MKFINYSMGVKKVSHYFLDIFVYIIPLYFIYNNIRYYKVKIINCDEGFPFYGFVEHNTIDILHYRFAHAIYSIMPIAFNVLGFDINTIAISYAISLVAPLFLTMYILNKKGHKYYTIFILSFTFLISYQFYFPIAEYWLGSCFYFIIYMIIDNYRSALIQKIVLMILFVLTINLHLSLLYPILVLLIYSYITNKIDMKMFLYIIISIILYTLIKFTFLTTNYESNIIGLDNFSIQSFNILNSRILSEFMESKDWFFILFPIVFILYKTTRHNYKINIILILFILISIIIFNLIFKDLPYFFYTIGNLRILLIFLPILFYEYCPRVIFKPIVIFLIINGIYNIERIGLLLERRYKNIASLVSESNNNIIYIFDDNVCNVHYKYFYMQTITVNLLENGRNNYFAFYNPELSNIEYLKKDFIKHNKINHKEYKNNYMNYRIKNLSDTKFTIYDFLIDRNITECMLE